MVACIVTKPTHVLPVVVYTAPRATEMVDQLRAWGIKQLNHDVWKHPTRDIYYTLVPAKDVKSGK